MAAFRGNPRIYVARSIFSNLLSSVPEKPSISSSRAAKSAIRSELDPEKLAEIFQKFSNLSRFRQDRTVFDLSVRKLAGFGRPDLIERILEDQKSPGPKSEGFWIRIMMLYSKSGMIDQAVRTFHQMEELGLNRTEKSLCALLSVFLDNGQFDRLHESFAEIPLKIGVSPDVAAYNLVLKAFCKQKSVEPARSLLEKMEEEKGVKPDITSYNILLSAYLRSGDDSNFDEILKEVSKKGLNPNFVTYSHRISRLCRAKENIRAKKLLNEMVSKGIKPNSTSYNTVIDGFCKVGDFDSAKKVLESMSSNESSASPNSDTYLILIGHLVEEGEFEAALEMCKESMKRNWILPFASVQDLVSGLVKISKVGEAKEIVEKMKKRLKGSAVDSWKKVEAALPL